MVIQQDYREGDKSNMTLNLLNVTGRGKNCEKIPDTTEKKYIRTYVKIYNVINPKLDLNFNY